MCTYFRFGVMACTFDFMRLHSQKHSHAALLRKLGNSILNFVRKLAIIRLNMKVRQIMWYTFCVIISWKLHSSKVSILQYFRWAGYDLEIDVWFCACVTLSVWHAKTCQILKSSGMYLSQIHVFETSFLIMTSCCTCPMLRNYLTRFNCCELNSS